MATFKYLDYEFYYEIHGDMTNPFLLLNGIMMSTKSWQVFVPEFSERNTLILFDFLDQGQSSRAHGPYEQALQVEILKAFLDHLKIVSLPIVGISYGSEVALQFVIRYPSYVSRLLLLNSTACTGPWLKDIGDGWNKAGESGDGHAYYLASIPLIYSPKFYKDNLEWMKAREAKLVPLFNNKEVVAAFIRLTKSAESYDVRDFLDTVVCPTLIVSSRQDYLTPFEEQVYLKENIKGSDHIMIEDAGHASMYEKPALFVSIVLGFVNQEAKKYII